MAAKENFRDRVRRHSLAWVMSDKTRVLILGGGFGGLYAALEFEKRNDRASKSRSFRRGTVESRPTFGSKQKNDRRCLRYQLEPIRHEHNY